MHREGPVQRVEAPTVLFEREHLIQDMRKELSPLIRKVTALGDSLEEIKETRLMAQAAAIHEQASGIGAEMAAVGLEESVARLQGIEEQLTTVVARVRGEGKAREGGPWQ